MRNSVKIALVFVLAWQGVLANQAEAKGIFKPLWTLPVSCLVALNSLGCASSTPAVMQSDLVARNEATENVRVLAQRDNAAINIDFSKQAAQVPSTTPLSDQRLDRLFSPSSRDPFGIGTSYKGFAERTWFHETATTKGLYIDLPKGEYGTNATGVSAKIPYDLKANAIHLSTEVSVDGAKIRGNELLFGKMGKLMGVCIAECATGKNPSNGSNGASVRVSYRKVGKELGVFLYMYHIDQKEDYGTYAPAPYKKAVRGLRKLTVKNPANPPVMKLGLEQTNKIDLFVELNTPGKANGTASLYLNNQMVVEVGEINFRNQAEDTFSGLAMDVFQGGGSEYTMETEGGFLVQKISILKK